MFYFGFDRVSGNAVYDDSGSGNNGELTSLATVTKTSGNCGNGLRLHGGESKVANTTRNVFDVRTLLPEDKKQQHDRLEVHF